MLDSIEHLRRSDFSASAEKIVSILFKIKWNSYIIILLFVNKRQLDEAQIFAYLA